MNVSPHQNSLVLYRANKKAVNKTRNFKKQVFKNPQNYQIPLVLKLLKTTLKKSTKFPNKKQKEGTKNQIENRKLFSIIFYDHFGKNCPILGKDSPITLLFLNSPKIMLCNSGLSSALVAAFFSFLFEEVM